MRFATLILLIFGLSSFITACTHMNPFPINMSDAIRKVSSPCEHEGLAEHYEDRSKKLNSIIKEHKKALSAYETLTSNHEKERSLFQHQSKILIDLYEQAAKINADMANSHRTIADEIK